MADERVDDQMVDDLREARRQWAEAEQLAKMQAVALGKIRAMANEALGVSVGGSDPPTAIKAVHNLDQAHKALCELRTEIEHFVDRVAPLLAVTGSKRG